MAPTKAGGKAYHHGDLAHALLKAGLKLLDRGGIEAVTVRAVAREAGVAHSAPANHFKDRAALLRGLAVGVFQDLAAAVEKALDTDRSAPRAQLHAMSDVILGYALRHPHRYRLLWRRENFAADGSPVEAAGTVLYDTLKGILGRGARTGRTSVDSDVIAAWSLIHGYVSLRLEGTLTEGRDEVSGKSRASAIVDVLIDGLSSGK